MIRDKYLYDLKETLSITKTLTNQPTERRQDRVTGKLNYVYIPIQPSSPLFNLTETVHMCL